MLLETLIDELFDKPGLVSLDFYYRKTERNYELYILTVRQFKLINVMNMLSHYLFNLFFISSASKLCYWPSWRGLALLTIKELMRLLEEVKLA